MRTSVDAKYSIVNDDRKRQEVKHVCKVCPDMRGAVFSYAFGVKAVGLA
jgi:hypothetical protein